MEGQPTEAVTMKLHTYFDKFMKDVVNLNDARLRDLDSRVETLYGVLAGDPDLGDKVLGKDPQGSWAHNTIIKPIEGNEFDADFMLILAEQDGWSPRQYIQVVYDVFKATETYRDKTTRKDRCVRIAYANDCHIDIVPFVELADGRQVIANYDTDDWEETDPAEFTAWMKRQDDTANGNLRRTIRLMKYLRDHHMQFKRSKSVILTVLLGERVSEIKKVVSPDYYGDLPTAFVHILEDLNEWMQARPTLPHLPDPSGANNDFDHRWDQASYDNLRAKVKTIAEDSRAALDDTSVENSLLLWQAVFGTDFKKPPSTSTAAAAATTAAPAVRSVRSGRDG